MRHIIFCLMFIACLSACVADEQQLPTATTISEARPTETATASPVLMPANTATSTHTPTIVPTTTPAPTETPTPLPPFTTGRVVFLWNPEPSPTPDPSNGFSIITTYLYTAIPGSSPENWQIEPPIGIRGQVDLVLSPEKNNMAVVSHFPGGGGAISWEVNIYDPFFDSFHQLVRPGLGPMSISWSGDGDQLAYSESVELFVLNMDGTVHQEIGIIQKLGDIAWSLDGKFLAIYRYDGQLDFLDLETDELLPVTSGLSNSEGTKIVWSADSQWLFIFQPDLLSLVFAETQQVFQVAGAGATSVMWSPYASLLIYTLGHTLFLWDAETQIPREIVTMDSLGIPAWSPDGSKIAAPFLNDDQSGILLIDPNTNTWEAIYLEMYVGEVVWSTDGQWLLFSGNRDNQTGLFLISATGGEPFLFLDTTGKNFPTQLFWILEPSTP